MVSELETDQYHFFETDIGSQMSADIIAHLLSLTICSDAETLFWAERTQNIPFV